jgi:L-cysteine:1D-myo-inositol 2-amino-2-deoxy-alpha-D-glucopyranoside ligase
MIFVRDLLTRYSANAVRVYLLQHHYRQVWEWSPADMQAAADVASALERSAHAADASPGDAREMFAAALADDLDTPRGLAALARASGGTLRELGSVLGLAL